MNESHQQPRLVIHTGLIKAFGIFFVGLIVGTLFQKSQVDSGGALLLKKEGENAALRDQLAKTLNDRLASAKMDLAMVIGETSELRYVLAEAKRISSESGIGEDLVIHNLARSFERNSFEDTQRALNNLSRHDAEALKAILAQGKHKP